MRRMRTLLLCAAAPLCATFAPARLSAQTDLSTVAQQVASAWTRHDFGAIIGSARVELRIPGVAAAGPIPGEQARALLTAYVRDAEEIEITVTGFDAVSGGSGYAQLRRKFRRGGAGEPQEDSILLGYSKQGGGQGEGGRGGWVLTVIQISGTQRTR